MPAASRPGLVGTSPLPRRSLLFGGLSVALAACEARTWIRAPDGVNWQGTLRSRLGTVRFDARCPQKGTSTPRGIVVVFSDFQCHACGLLARDLEELLQEQLPIRVVFKHFPLPMHKDAYRYAIVSQALWRGAGSESFWRVQDALFQSPPASETLDDWLSNLGISPAVVRKQESAARQDVDEQVREARALGLDTTPFLFLGDHTIPGRIPFENLRGLVLDLAG